MTYTRTFTHELDGHNPDGCLGCERCGHFACQHRLDDSTNVSLTDPAAEFRCLGPGLDGCEDSCPDFVGQAIDLAGIE